MECMAKKDDLVRMLKLASGVASKRSTMPILGNVRLTSEEGALRLSATDLTTAVSAVIPAQIRQPGDVTTDAANLLAIMQAAPAADVLVRSDDRIGWIEVKSGKSAWKSNGLPGKDFPTLRDPASARMVEVDASALRTLIERTLFAAAVAESQPHLQGVLFEGDGHVLATVAIDGHRLAKATATLDMPYAVRAVVPSEGCRHMAQVLNGVEKAEIGVEHGTYFFLRLPTLWYAHKLLDAHGFPPYERAIPTAMAYEAVVGRDAAIAAVERVQIAMFRTDGGMHYRLRPGTLALEAESPLGHAEDEIELEMAEGTAAAFKMNPAYMLSMLKHAPGDKVRLRVGNPTDPVLVEALDRMAFAGLVMPMVA